MATINASIEANFVAYSRFTWTPLANGDDGDGAQYMGSGDRSIQIKGTFGAGGTVIVEGTNDNVSWYQLKDATGTAISFTAAGIKQILENPLAIRPRVTAGDGTTAITATLVVRKD